MWTTIKVRREVKEALKREAEARGLTLSAFLALVAEQFRLERLEARLAELEERVARLEEARGPPTEDRAEPPVGELPSFVRDNPWLEVLRKRGRESFKKP